MTTILGIDPGSRVTGFGIIKVVENELTYVTSGCIKPKNAPLFSRLKEIFENVSKVINLYDIDQVAVEEVFFHKNPNSALKLGQARGAAIVGATIKNCEVFEYSTRQIKQSVVGYGGAKKEQIQHMVLNLLKLQGDIQEDSADALAVAICHSHMQRNSSKHYGKNISLKKGRIQ